jgi:hypothetical protein
MVVFIVPLIFLLTILTRNKVYSTASVTLNTLVLLGSICFLTVIITNTTTIYFSGNEEEKNFVGGMFTGSQAHELWIPLLNFGLLPQLLWIRNFYSRIYFLFGLVAWWYISWEVQLNALPTTVGSHTAAQRSFFFRIDSIWHVLVFIMLYSLIFFVVKNRKENIR